MKFLADMGISQSTVRWLRQLGHDAVHLREQGLQRLPDDEIIEKARSENRVILTCDLDFGALLATSGAKLPSVIIFRLENEKPDASGTGRNGSSQMVLLESYKTRSFQYSFEDY